MRWRHVLVVLVLAVVVAALFRHLDALAQGQAGEAVCFDGRLSTGGTWGPC